MMATHYTISRKLLGGLGGVLFLSLGLNLFMAGWIAARPSVAGIDKQVHGQDGDRDSRSSHGFKFNNLRMVASLSPRDRAVFRRSMMQSRGEARAATEDLAKASQTAQLELRAEPFDVDAFDTSLRALRAAQARMQDVIDGVILTAAPQISAEGRQKLSQMQSLSAERRARNPTKAQDRPARDPKAVPNPEYRSEPDVMPGQE